MRSTLTTISVVALLAAGTGSAAARPDMPLSHRPYSSNAVAAPSVGVQHRYLGSDATPAPSLGGSAPAPAVHVARTQVADGGVDWADVGIGAGLAGALLLSAAGMSAARRQSPMRAR